MPGANQSRTGLERARPYEVAVSAFSLVAAGAVAAFARSGQLPGHELAQILPFVWHLAFTGCAIGLMAYANGTRSWAGRSGMVRVGTFLAAYGLGVIGLFLAVQAVFGLTKSNAPALLLAVPGVAVFLPTFMAPEQKYLGEEVLKEIPHVPFRYVLAGFGGSLVRQVIGWCTVIIGAVVGFGWYWILHDVLWNGARYDLMNVARNALTTASTAWPAIIPLAFVGIVVAVSNWSPLFRQSFDRMKEGLGVGRLSEAQRSEVQRRLQSIWDYANAPENEKGTLAGLLLPVLPMLIPVGIGFALLIYCDEIAATFFPPTIPPTPEGWSFVVRDGGANIWPLLLQWPVAWSMYRLTVDCWPRALQQSLLSDFQRGPSLDTSKIRAVRRALSRDVLRGRLSTDFPPREYLLARRRRGNRWLYSVSVITFVAALFLFWRAFATYTIATAAGVEDTDFLTGRHVSYAYADATVVRPECFLSSKTDVEYRGEFRDGRTVDFLYAKDLPGSLPGLKRIDDRFRGTRAVFAPLADNPLGERHAKECVEELGTKYRDRDGFARVMHVSG